jgi:hypothetical protein
VASYLVENSVGSYQLSEHTAADGIRYYQAQSSSLSAAQQQANRVIMAKQQDITNFQSHFNGPFPFRSDGVLIGTPDAGFEEEMQTMIAFASGTVDLDTLYHENMHQWWGDNVTESNYNMTFFKEGMATLGEFLFAARTAGQTGGPAAYQASLVNQFNDDYARNGAFWANAPSKPTAYNLFDGSSTYERPGIAYIALRQILGPSRFNQALQQIQRQYGGGTIDERQLEAGFARWLPNRSEDCRDKLGQFFRQWFDTGYSGGKPTITGPGLAGGGFYNAHGGCSSH